VIAITIFFPTEEEKAFSNEFKAGSFVSDHRELRTELFGL
jgi:hypothetical protein